MNKWIGMGRLTKDPELSYTQTSSKAVCKFTLAVDRRMSKEKETDFINCVAWEKTAEFIAKYFSKGSKIAVVGSIQTRTYEKDDHTVYVTEVIVHEAEFCESKQAKESTDDSPMLKHDEQEVLDDDDIGLPF